MWIFLGLGNPGATYQNTRHNAGARVLEMFRAQHEDVFSTWRENAGALISGGEYGGVPVSLVLPQKYMNLSGEVARVVCKDEKMAQNMVVFYDDIDLPLGVVRLSYDRGSGGHKGVSSIETHVGTRKFLRVRIGILKKNLFGVVKKPKGEDAVQKFVLGSLSSREKQIFEKDVYPRIERTIETLLSEGMESAMQVCNTQ